MVDYRQSNRKDLDEAVGVHPVNCMTERTSRGANSTIGREGERTFTDQKDVVMMDKAIGHTR